MRTQTNETRKTHVESICHVVYFIASRFILQIFACVCRIRENAHGPTRATFHVHIGTTTEISFCCSVCARLRYSQARPMAIIFVVSVFNACILCEIENSKRCVIGNIEIRKWKTRSSQIHIHTHTHARRVRE